MLLEFIEGTLIEELDLSEEEVVRIGRTVLAQITKMAGTRPYWFDVSDQEKWKTFIQALLDDLKKLIDRGKFTRTNRTTVHNLEHWAFSKSVLAAICSQSGYVHHDFTGDNLFVLPNGYRVIDWQRPIWGPIDLDMVSLLMSLGFDPVKYVEEGTIQVMHFLSIHWFTQCAARWFPEGADHYDEQIVQITAQIEKSYIEE